MALQKRQPRMIIIISVLWRLWPSQKIRLKGINIEYSLRNGPARSPSSKGHIIKLYTCVFSSPVLPMSRSDRYLMSKQSTNQTKKEQVKIADRQTNIKNVNWRKQWENSLNTIINALMEIRYAQAVLTLHCFNMHEYQLHSLLYNAGPLVIQLRFQLP